MLSPQAGIAAPIVTVMQGFEVKKGSFVHPLPNSCMLYHTCTTQPRIEPRCGGLKAEYHNHYTTQLAAMKGENVGFKSNVWEKSNGSCVSICMTSFYNDVGMKWIGFRSEADLLIFSLTQSNFETEFSKFPHLYFLNVSKSYENWVKLAFIRNKLYARKVCQWLKPFVSCRWHQRLVASRPV